MTALAQSLAVKAESTYGTAVTPDRFYEISGESLRLDVGRTRSAGLRSGQRGDRTDRFLPFKVGVSGGWTMDVPTKGFGVILKQIFGAVSTGSVSDANYTHTFTPGTLVGKSLTVEVNRPDTTASDQAFTFEGVKITTAEFACDVDGVLTCDLGVIGEDQTANTSPTAASYSSDFRVFSFVNGSMTIASTATPITGWRFRCTNSFDTRRFVRGSALTKEPLENGKRMYEMEFTADFDSMTNYNRFVSSTASGAYAAVATTFDGDVAHGGSTVPRLVFTASNLDFTNVSGPNVVGNDIIRCTFSGLALDDGSNYVSVTYRTTDATP